ncbi:MAG: glycosyltransferase [Pyrinomonadaceae bacterium]|nr:glycosyltransferase [Pyrinomonadaceae bacterium]
MVIVFYILAALLIYFSYRSFRGGISYLEYFKREIAKPPSDWQPYVSVFAPCKGVDDGMLENFDALLHQDYPEYEVIFVIDDPDDPAAEVIETAWREAERHVKLVVAGRSEDSSQKVENLREAVRHASEDSEVFVFVDSDARPSPGWLRSLVSPLASNDIGAATGYRWFIARKPDLATELRSVWNASVASALGPKTEGNFCWGGSTAIRRGTFEQLNIRDRWRGTVSDDFTMTRALSEANLAIKFVPQAVTASVENCTLCEMLEFTTRQMKITRVYRQGLWITSFIGSGLFCVVTIWALLIVLLSPANSFAVWAAILTLAAVSVLSVGKAWLRLKAVMLVLPQFENQLRRQMFTQNTLWAVTPFIFFYNCVAALLSRTIDWRGTEYELISHDRTRIRGRSK